jgi:hypothetical protein
MATNGAPGPTPVSGRRSIPAAPKSTKAPQHRLPVSGAGPLTMTRRTPTAKVTGPPAWENGRDRVYTPAGTPPLHGAGAADCMPGSC